MVNGLVTVNDYKSSRLGKYRSKYLNFSVYSSNQQYM